MHTFFSCPNCVYEIFKLTQRQTRNKVSKLIVNVKTCMNDVHYQFVHDSTFLLFFCCVIFNETIPGRKLLQTEKTDKQENE